MMFSSICPLPKSTPDKELLPVPVGQTKERKTTLTMGLGIVMTKSLRTLRVTTLMERVLWA